MIWLALLGKEVVLPGLKPTKPASSFISAGANRKLLWLVFLGAKSAYREGSGICLTLLFLEVLRSGRGSGKKESLERKVICFANIFLNFAREVYSVVGFLG